MKTKLSSLSEQYLTALRTHLEPGPMGNLQPAGELGRQALGIGLQTLDLARIHERSLTTLMPPGGFSGTRNGVIKRAETFFIEAITPIEQSHRVAMETNVQLNQLNQTLRQRTIELAAANRRLKQEIVRRRAGEEALKKNQQHYRQLLEQSCHQQEQSSKIL